jgi:hypothetical protein
VISSQRLGHVPGFRGCIAALRIADENLDVFDDAEETVQVKKGCAGTWGLDGNEKLI